FGRGQKLCAAAGQRAGLASALPENLLTHRSDPPLISPGARRSVMTVRNSSRPIARVFRATAAPGCRDELLQRFHSSSAALVNSKVGCLKYRILEPVDASAPEVVFESIWRDLDSVKVAFGDAWQQSHLPEGYSALMTAYSVHHFLVSESSVTK
ncbi:MAG: antibiotic biosynthesis monooxygenase, partial [Pseudolabrys sp.]